MNTTNGLETVKTILGFSFRDPNWKSKYLIGSALVFAGTALPVLPWLPVMGYGAKILRRSAAGEAVLPEWDDWNTLLMDGLRQFGVSFILSLPLLAVMLIGYGLYFLSFLWMGGDSGEPGAFFLLSFIILWIAIGLSIVLTLVTLLLVAPAQASVAVQRDFSAFLRVREWWQVLRSNLGGYLIVVFFLLGLYTVIMFALQMIYLSIFLCCLIPLLIAPLGFYALVVYYYVNGLAYGESSGSPVTETPPPGPELTQVDSGAGI